MLTFLLLIISIIHTGAVVVKGTLLSMLLYATCSENIRNRPAVQVCVKQYETS